MESSEEDDETENYHHFFNFSITNEGNKNSNLENSI